MRRLAMVLAVLLTVLLLPGGCGGDGLSGKVMEMLERRSGEIDAIAYTCVTEDAERLYREDFELLFPDEYRYRFYEITGGRERLLNHTIQEGNSLYRARVAQGSEGEDDSLLVETLTSIPPIRCTGTYLALYHLIGNVDYFQSLLALIEGGELVVAGTEDLEGRGAYLLESASGLTPHMRIWLDRDTGLPLRKELALSADRAVIFRYENVVENPTDMEPFPPDAAALFGDPGMSVSYEKRDGDCRAVDVADASEQAGFSPLLPRLQGFELAAVLVRDPAVGGLTSSDESTRFPEGFRELYLVLRSGARQVEIRQSPYDPEFSYYTTGMGALSGAYLSRQEVFGEDAAGASYTAAMDCQEMRLTLDDIEVMVTGDLSREEFESLAVQLRQLAESAP